MRVTTFYHKRKGQVTSSFNHSFKTAKYGCQRLSSNLYLITGEHTGNYSMFGELTMQRAYSGPKQFPAFAWTTEESSLRACQWSGQLQGLQLSLFDFPRPKFEACLLSSFVFRILSSRTCLVESTIHSCCQPCYWPSRWVRDWVQFHLQSWTRLDELSGLAIVVASLEPES